jgi:hypothetical protein
MFVQEDYTISERRLEYSKVMSVFKYLIENYNENSPIDSELLEKTYQELKNNKGIGVSPQAYNNIIRALLAFVPDKIKNY